MNHTLVVYIAQLGRDLVRVRYRSFIEVCEFVLIVCDACALGLLLTIVFFVFFFIFFFFFFSFLFFFSFFFFKQKTAYEIRNCDWSSDVCSSDLKMIEDLEVSSEHVAFTVVLTTPACPLKELIKSNCEEAVRKVVGEEVKLEITMSSNEIGRASCRERV